MKTLADEIIYGTKASVQAFIEQHHPDVNETDEYGFNPIIEATIVNKTDIGLYLIQLGVNVNLADTTERTALHWAAENNNIELARLLLQQNADPNAYTAGSQPVLVVPLLRKQKKMINLLIEHGADLNFAKDYINTKMLGHIYNLQGVVDIVNHKRAFIELSYEGYILEFMLYAIYDALHSFINHYSAKPFRSYFGYLRPILKSLGGAAELIQYQQYNLDRKHYVQRIHEILSRDLLLIPLAYIGHAISFIKFGNIWVRCDRGEYGRKYGCINIYQLQNPHNITPEFLSKLIYTKQTKEFITEGLDELLQLTPLTQIPIAPQITGNCSWANIEASIPTILFLLLKHHHSLPNLNDEEIKKQALTVYQFWLEWYQDKTLNECIDSFYQASPARKASKAAVLGAVLIQQCHYENIRNIDRVNRIIKILMIQEYQPILISYLQAYCYPMTLGGKNLRSLLESCGIDPDSLV
ncbi:MAG: hypothetical protein A3E87_03900 [Gammaproteobacteria bacterium RIFCSPHIGHO2_12_FULL_35_23]|nr:MAG: hypothetical protein A3E87_03900 [Gammaproteobacteria bacterium RIFCSPHIGHO2_12_FULL_35_23]